MSSTRVASPASEGTGQAALVLIIADICEWKLLTWQATGVLTIEQLGHFGFLWGGDTTAHVLENTGAREHAAAFATRSLCKRRRDIVVWNGQTRVFRSQISQIGLVR